MTAAPVRRVGDHADHMPDPAVAQMRAGQPLLDGGDPTGGQATVAVAVAVTVHHEDAHGIRG